MSMRLFLRCVIWTFALSRMALSAPNETDLVVQLQPGESIWSLSQKYLEQPARWIDLRDYNGVRKDRQLSPGTPVRIPVAWLKKADLTIKVTYLTGRASVSVANAASQSLAAGTKLRSGDRVQTEAQSYLSMRLPDGSEVLLLPQSDVTVQASGYHATQATHVVFKLNKGRLETRVMPQRVPGSTYEITTPTAQLGVRGTEFRVALSEESSSSISEVEEGVVAASNPTLAKSPRIDVGAGFATVVRAGEAPLPPVAMLPAPDLRAVAGLALGREIEQSFDVIPGARRYRIQLSHDPQFRGVLSEQLSSQPRYRFSMLPEGQYYFRVRAVDGLGIEGRDARVAFQVRELDL